MKKTILILFIVMITLVSSVLFGMWVYQLTNKKNEEKMNVAVTDECINEVADVENEESLETSTNDKEKISPNAVLVLKKYYENCKHWVTEYPELPPELINMTEKELENEYPEWELEKFSENEITLTKKIDGYCGEHYVLKDEDGMISVYKVSESGEEELYERTEIATEYLTETDLINIKSGIKIYGKENLNSMLEDFE